MRTFGVPPWRNGNLQIATLWQTNSLLLEMAIEIVDLAINNGDFPVLKLLIYTRG